MGELRILDEMFPGLKGKYRRMQTSTGFETGIIEIKSYEVISNCLDKQKVKEAINAIFTDWKPEDITCECKDCQNIKTQLVERDKLFKILRLE